jgi:3-oxoacyl-[acyl-carrier protein] reductase
MNQIDLAQRVAVVTGGAQGIGQAIAQRMLRSGATLVLWDRDAAQLAAAQETLSALGPVSTHRLELTEDVAVEAAARRARRARPHRHPRQQRRHHRRQRAHVGARAEVWREVIEVNLVAPYLTCRAVVPHMPRAATAASSTSPRSRARKATRTRRTTARRRPASSRSPSRSARSSRSAACWSTRLAAAARTRDVRHDDAAAHRLHAVEDPDGRFLEVDEAAAMVAWLASEECSFTTGSVFDLSGGRATY